MLSRPHVWSRFDKVLAETHSSSFQKVKSVLRFANRIRQKRNSFVCWAKVISSARRHYKGECWIIIIVCIFKIIYLNLFFLIFSAMIYEQQTLFPILKRASPVWWLIATPSINQYPIWTKSVTNTTTNVRWSARGNLTWHFYTILIDTFGSFGARNKKTIELNSVNFSCLPFHKIKRDIKLDGM